MSSLNAHNRTSRSLRVTTIIVGLVLGVGIISAVDRRRHVWQRNHIYSALCAARRLPRPDGRRFATPNSAPPTPTLAASIISSPRLWRADRASIRLGALHRDPDRRDCRRRLVYGDYAQPVRIPLGAYGAAIHAVIAIIVLTAINITRHRGRARRTQNASSPAWTSSPCSR